MENKKTKKGFVIEASAIMEIVNILGKLPAIDVGHLMSIQIIDKKTKNVGLIGISEIEIPIENLPIKVIEKK